MLPEAYRFAILDREGTVLLHSDAGRNDRENLIEETENDSQLRSLLRGRGTALLDASYQGSFQRLRVQPLADSPWFLAVMRDKLPIQSSNVQVLLVTSTVIVICTALVFCFFAFLHRLLKVKLSWIWQPHTLGDQYACLASGFAAVLVAFSVALILWPAGKLFLVIVLLIPLAVVVALRSLECVITEQGNWRRLRNTGRLDKSVLVGIFLLMPVALIGNYDSGDWVVSLLIWLGLTLGLLRAAVMTLPRGAVAARPNGRRYAVAAALFLTLLSVAPTLGVFRIVAESEVRRFAKNVQYRLGEALEARDLRIESSASRLGFSQEGRLAYLKRTLPVDGAPDVYADIFLSTRVSLSTNTADDADDSGAADRVCDELDLSCALTAAITVALERLTTVYDLSSMALASLSYRRSDDERLSWPSDSWQGGNLLAFEKRNYAGSGAAVRPTLELRSSLPGVSLPLVLVTLLGCLLPQFFVQRFLKNRLFVGDLGKIPSTVEPAIPDDRIQRHLFLLAGEGPWKTDLIRRPDIECVDLACAPWIDLDTDWQRVRNWREDTEGPVIFLDHFDVHSDDVDATREKIRLLEHLIGMCNRTVLLATARAPENFSLSRTDGGEPHRELRARWLALLRQFQRVYPDAERREDEGEPTYYERLWSVSTRSERAVMVRLWQTGLVNLKRRWVTRRLLSSRREPRRGPWRGRSGSYRRPGVRSVDASRRYSAHEKGRRKGRRGCRRTRLAANASSFPAERRAATGPAHQSLAGPSRKRKNRESGDCPGAGMGR